MKHLNKLLILCIFVLLNLIIKPETAISQSIIRQCISSNASLSQLNGTYFSTSTGQIYSCQTNSQNSNHALQGFQQPVQIRITSLSNKEKSNFAFQISPNPSSGFIQIDANRKIEKSQIKIIDKSGRILLDQKNSDWSQQSINLQTYLDGEYFLQITDHSQFSETYKLLIFK